MYCGTKYLDYQGMELSKALMLFHEGSVLDESNLNVFYRYGVVLFTGGYIKGDDGAIRKMS
jgi:hypothetical protein